MYMNILTILQAGEATGGSSNGWTMWIFLIALIALMWFFMIRPQRKQQKELQAFREGLRRGDKVVTVGGIHGTVVEIKEKTLLLEIDANVKIRVEKNSVVKDYSESDAPNNQ